MISLNLLPASTKSLFLALSEVNQDGILEDFILIGGTALSMRIEHRLSEDLDFAVTAPKLPRHKIEKLLQRLASGGAEIVDITNVGARDDFIDTGFDLEDYHQDWLVNNTKLTFFTYGNNDYENKVIKESSFDVCNGVKIASIATIAKTKCHALTRRMKSRDLFDIYHLIAAGHLSMEDVVAEMQRSNLHMTFETCTHRILEKPIQADDEGLTPIGINKSIDEIRAYLAEKVGELEQTISESLLPHYNRAPDGEHKR